MSFTEKEKRDWHANRKAGQRDDHLTSVHCAHCGAPAPMAELGSEFPLCDACDD